MFLNTDLIPDEYRLRLLFRDPKIRPPVLEEIHSDCARIARNLGKQYCDQSCYALHEDEIAGVVMERLAHLIDRNYLLRDRGGNVMTRHNFFRLFTSAANNKIRSLVQKHIFTAKRTGFKPPSRDENGFNEHIHKATMVYLDDPDKHAQVAETSGAGDLEHLQCTKDFKLLLSGAELLVFNQLAEPNQTSVILATIDAFRAEESKRKIVILDKHHAGGLGMNLAEFSRLKECLQHKYRRFMSDKKEDTQFNVAVKTLSDFFSVEIPPSVETPVIRRMFTLLARESYERLTDDIKEKLNVVGALIPEMIGNAPNCFGVLFDEKDSSCRRCGVREGCQVKAANHGLGTITLSKNLIRQNRIPVITAPAIDSEETDDEPLILSARDEDLYNYLCSQLKRFKYKDEGWAFTHKNERGFEPVPPNPPIIILNRQGRFRVCKPSRQLIPELTNYKKFYYIPEECDSDEAIALVNLHIKASLETLSEKEPSAA